MGHELNKLMNKLGIASPSVPVAPSMPVAPPPPPKAPIAPVPPPVKDGKASLLEYAKYQSDKKAYDTANATYLKDKAAYDEKYAGANEAYAAAMEKWKDDKALEQQYKDLVGQRVATTNLYGPAQNRQVVQAPIYSYMDPSKMPSLQKTDTGYARIPQYTTSTQTRDTTDLPSLISKYAQAAPATTAATATPAAQSNTAFSSKSLAQAQWDKDREAYAKSISSQYPSTVSNRQQPSSYGYETAMAEWEAQHKMGVGNYSYSEGEIPRARGGIISLAKKYADGGPVTASADQQKAWAADPLLQQGNDALMKKDYNTAAQFFMQAANGGNAQAQNNLGTLYAQGTGVPRNDVEAAKWLNVASQSGYAGASSNLNAISGRMTDNQKAMASQLATTYAGMDEKARQADFAKAQAGMTAFQNRQAATATAEKARQEAAAAAAEKARQEAAAAAAEKARQEAATAAAEKARQEAATAVEQPVTKTDTTNVATDIKNLDTGKLDAPALDETTLTPPPVTPSLGSGEAEKTTQVVAPPPPVAPNVTNVATGAMTNAPAIGGVTMNTPSAAPAAPALGSGVTPAKTFGTTITNPIGLSQNPVVKSIFGNLNLGTMQPSAPSTNTNLADIFSNYTSGLNKQATTQASLAKDRQNYINSLYASGTYDPEAIAQWDQQHRMGQGAYQYKKGGAVKTHYGTGDLVDLGDTTDADANAGSDPSAYDALMNKYQGVSAEELQAARADYRAKQQSMLDSLIKYQQSQASVKPDKSEMYFRLAQAFLTPGKTGSLGENIAAAAGVAADYNKEVAAQRRAEAAAMLQTELKQKELMANMSEDDLKTLQALQTTAGQRQFSIDLAKARAAANAKAPTTSEYEKVAIGMGYTPGTKEFQQKVQSLWDQAHRAPAGTNLTGERKLTPGELKLKSDSESLLNSFDQSLADLAKAYELNKNSYGGSAPERASFYLESQLGSKDPKVLNTQELNNILGKETVAQLKSTFGSQFTAAEGQKLEELSGIHAKTKEERARILMNAYQLLKQKKALEAQRYNDIATGGYGITE